jgi:hypothetical protein
MTGREEMHNGTEFWCGNMKENTILKTWEQKRGRN